MGSRLPALSACRMRVVVGLVALALLLSFPAIEARAQSAAADLPGAPVPTLLAVVLSTAADTSQRPSATLPESLQDKSLYWRRLRSGDAVRYQLCLGFFGTRSDAERARQQLAPRFPEARVISVSPRESANVLQARQGVRPAPAAAPPPPAPESEWSRWK
jgi:hypothetical protein